MRTVMLGLGALAVDAFKICVWLWALFFLNPMYSTITVKEPKDVEKDLVELTSQLIEGVVRLPWASAQQEAAAARARADVTRPEANAPEGPAPGEKDDILDQLVPCAELQPDATLLQERFGHQDPDSGTARSLHAVLTAAFDAKKKEDRPENISLRREDEPLNDYLQRDHIIYGAFPTTFVLGSGLGPGTGPLKQKVRKWLLSHFSRRPGRDQRLLTYLHNVKFRSDAAKVAAASVHRCKSFWIS